MAPMRHLMAVITLTAIDDKSNSSMRAVNQPVPAARTSLATGSDNPNQHHQHHHFIGPASARNIVKRDISYENVVRPSVRHTRNKS